MKNIRTLRRAAFAAASAAVTGVAIMALPLLPARAADSYDIDVVVPMTGGGSFVGVGQKASLDAFQASVNGSGGIGGKPLNFVYHDDQTSPQTAVQLANQVLAKHPAVFLGSSLVGMCAAMGPLVKNGPLMFCLSPGYHPDKGSYTFSASSSSTDQVNAVVRYFRLKGLTKIAVLNSSDASGQDGDHAVDTALALPENKGMQKVAGEHFNVTDVSVAAQIEKIRASGAQALISWTTGAPVATVFRGMVQAGLDIPVAPTSGNQTFAQMDQYAAFLPKQVVLPSALWPAHDGLLKLDPGVEAAQHDMYAALAKAKLRADNMVATSWDAGLIVVSGLRKLGPGATAAQLRDYIAGLTGFAGIDGMYDFTKYPERGLGPDTSTVTTYDTASKNWKWLSKPGGAPL